jgi:hypothetical protein
MKFQPRFRALTLACLASVSLPAIAQAATVTVTDITAEGPGGFKITVPSVEATDANLDEAAIRALFTSAFTDSAGGLATLDAATIKIPEITVTYDVPGAATTAVTSANATYRDVELSGVKDGIADVASLAEIEIGGGGMEGASITIGKMSTSLLDLGAILGFYGLGPVAGSDEMRPLYKDFVFEGGTLTSPFLNCTIGSASAAEFKARPLKGTMADLMKYTAELEAAETGGKPPSPEAILAVVNYYVDLLTAFESSSTEFSGFDCNATDPEGTNVTITTGPSTVGGFKPGIYPMIALNDFRMDIAGQGWLEFGNFTWKAMDLNGVLETLVEAGDALNSAWFEANWRKIIPAFDGFSVAGFSMDVPDTENAGQRIIAGIETFDVSLADYVNGIPSRVSTTGRGIRMAVPEGPNGDAVRALGLDVLDLGFEIASHWDEATKTISLEKLELSGANLGGITISGTIANAGPELFSPDTEIATVAATALTVTELKIDIENAGIVPTLIAAAAAEQQMPAEAFHVTLSGLAQALPLGLLGATPDALALSESLGQFLLGAPNLSITLTSTDPAGIGLAELMAAEQDPTVLKGKVTIAASASGEPVPFTWPEVAAPATPTPDATPAAPTTEEPAPAQESSPRDAEKESSKN